MREQEPMTQTMKISDVKNQLSSVVNRVYRKETRVLVEKSGIPVAALVSADDLKRLDELDALDREAWDVVASMRAPFRGEPVDEIERETERIVAENREADRQQR